MAELHDLYQEVVLEHNRQPRNYKALSPASHQARGHNPLCGDQVQVYLQVEQDVVRQVGFEGDGCAICMASASIMTETVYGRSVAEAARLFDAFHELLSDKAGAMELELGKLEVLAGVREFPSRVKCATLPWHTLQAALLEQGDVTVEKSE